MKVFAALVWFCASALFGYYVLSGVFGASSSLSPTRTVSRYVDGVSHADYRLACSQIQPAVRVKLWRGLRGCEAYFSSAFGQVAQYLGLGVYRVVAHSYVGWREGSVRVARVSVTTPSGSLLHVRLVKTAHGWAIASIGS